MTASSPALTVEQAAAAICAMINASPRSPRQAEIEAVVARATARPATLPISGVEAQLLEAVTECHAAEKALNEAARTCEPPVDDEAAIARYEAATDRMNELADQLPPAHSLANIMLRGHVAYLHADRNEHGTLSWLSSDDYGEVAAAKLVAEVLQYAGIDFR